MDIPFNLSDITEICKKFSTLSFKAKTTIEILFEEGIESIKTDQITQFELYEIKEFLQLIKNNPLFGDASNQADLILNELQYFITPKKQIYSYLN